MGRLFGLRSTWAVTYACSYRTQVAKGVCSPRNKMTETRDPEGCPHKPFLLDFQVLSN